VQQVNVNYLFPRGIYSRGARFGESHRNREYNVQVNLSVISPRTRPLYRWGDDMDRRKLLRVFARWSLFALIASIGSVVIPSKGSSEIDAANDFLEVALPILAKATAVRAFKLPKRLYAGEPDLTLGTLGPLPLSKELQPSQKDFLVSKLSDKSSYMFGVRKAMRFYADYGLIFEGSGIPNALLVSTDFRGARLVLGEPFSARTSIVNLDPIFPTLIEQLRKTFE
jgi:hypothetical protein